MAQLIPTLGAAKFDSQGELRTAERLKDFLEDNACVWHNLPVGPRGLHPDFVVIHPGHGLLVLEVKDWRLDNIASANKLQVALLTERGTFTVDNPFEQTDLAKVFSPERCIFRDEMTETAAPDRFRERCWAMVVRRIGGPLTLPQFVT
jgi:hypothetical protein